MNKIRNNKYLNKLRINKYKETKVKMLKQDNYKIRNNKV